MNEKKCYSILGVYISCRWLNVLEILWESVTEWVSIAERSVVSCLVLSCLVLSCLVLSCLVLSCLVLSCRVVSCRVVSCRVVSCRVVSCRVVSCLSHRVCLLQRAVREQDLWTSPWCLQRTVISPTPVSTLGEIHPLIWHFIYYNKSEVYIMA